ncbi:MULTISPECIES: CsgE family curli-type amyloid fiber assembly protein [unclassified Kaistella]|uniref:CsgE family curli-type amyloid fiber assembly protein n=1 Tax=unclassified Kaistella TaxID=2762626 RepID=UPI002732F389|nr:MULTISPECIES: CsgE family curli-type amyloid fiber assembly protein [unclassified Kaistella]MDP2453897.1 CsgE family curli-type amyloid fiber assembly protein [Kaistella sp. SH11-4b]MDP2456954.1 CsgE family curli-type amyloid fiber assembly protein [Kaistella sp. SH40-3]MDP2459711.1 CsgE family curli-type amyloid fiber assembly protein [Kaistella sp. SH19-2b]
MKNISKRISLIFLFFIGINTNAQDSNKVGAKIETHDVEGVFNLKAIAQNESEVFQSLNYIFLAVKKDKSKNMSSSKQENKFTLLPKETKVLSEISINVNKDDALKVYLFIKDEKTGKVIAKDSLEMNSKNMKNAVSYEKTTNEENIMMTNLIINDSKTRIGDEFYRKLYSVLMLNDIKFGFRVRIAEFPTTGTNMMLQVFANDENILAFMARPDDDYLDGAVQETIAGLIAYDHDRQVNDKGFIY